MESWCRRLTTAGEVTGPPEPHTAMFIGEYPCNGLGRRAGRHPTFRGTAANAGPLVHQLVLFQQARYSGINYPGLLRENDCLRGHPGEPGPGYRPGRQRTDISAWSGPEEDDDSVFYYLDSASSQGRHHHGERQAGLARVAIVGLGGTGCLRP